MKCILPSRFLRKLFALFLVMVLIVFQNTGLLTHAAISLKPQIEVMHLPSGQTVYVQEIHTQPIVTIDTWVNTGSAQENAQNNGVSHFLEHLLFKGTEKHKLGEIDRILESRGADFNAATSADFTHYHITTASQYFQEALDLHADMLMNATIHPEELDRERKVVQEEINRSLDNPGRKAYIALMTEMFGSHPYALDTLGPKSNIQGLPRQSILDYYHRWYQPENFKTVVVGDVNAQEVFKQVNTAFEKAYREQQRPNAGKVETFPVKAITEPRSEVLGDPNLSAVQWDLGFVAPPVSNKEDNYALDIAALVLGQGTSSRLYQDVKEDKQLVDDISAGNGTRQQAGIFAISAQMKPENREKAKKAILRQLELFKAEGPTPAELEKAKTQVIKDFAFLNESTDGVAQSIGYNVTIANLDDYTEYVEIIQKVDAKAVQDAARKYLNLNNAVMVEVLPGKDVKGLEQEASNNVSLLKAMAQSSPKPNTQPESKTETATTAPQVEKSVLPGGAVLLVKPTPSTQTVSFSIFAKGGRLMEPRPGVSSLASRVLMKGTEHFTAKELSQELERKGLALNASSDEDYLQVTGGSISDDFDQLLSLLQDVLVNPTFPEDEIAKEKADMLQQIKTNRDQPSGLMFENLTESLYPTHPYGAVGKRLEDAIPQITRNELIQYYREQMEPDNLVIAVVGNVDSKTTQLRMTALLNALKNKTADAASKAPENFPDVPPLKQNESVEAQKPEQAATWISYGWLAPGISTNRDYITLKVINALLGQGLSSRLFVDLREKQGLAYHVSSLYPSNLKNGSFVMYIGTAPQNQEKVITGFNEQIKRLQADPVTKDELDTVKSKLIGAFALAHESNANQAFYLGLYETLGVGYMFDKHYPELIEQVTPEDIQRVARLYFNQPKVVSIVAPKTVRGADASDAH